MIPDSQVTDDARAAAQGGRAVVYEHLVFPDDDEWARLVAEDEARRAAERAARGEEPIAPEEEAASEEPEVSGEEPAAEPETEGGEGDGAEEPQDSGDPFARYRVNPLQASGRAGFVSGETRRKRGLFDPMAREISEERVPVPTREIVCYACGRKSQIPDAALSAHCVHCRTHLNTADIELRPASRRLTIRTLGNVTLPSHVDLSHLSIVCRDMQMSGRGSGRIRCCGTLTLRGEARAEGQVQADALVVPSGARVEISPGATAERAEIEGRLVGRLHVRGTIHIAKGGVLEGDCYAEVLHMEPGGRHIGHWIQTLS